LPSKKKQVVKNAVVAKAIAGESKSKIAEDLGITRNTVRRILNETEINQFVGQGKSTLFELIPQAAEIYAAKVRANPDEAKDFLERVLVLPGKQAGNDAHIRFSVGTIADQIMTEKNANSTGPRVN
jgi:predicted transcriptional regulator